MTTTTQRWMVATLAVGLFACGRTEINPHARDGGPLSDVFIDVPFDTPDSDTLECVSDTDCSDDLVCNGAERCLRGTCVAGAPVPCDDGVACTSDRCVEASGGCESVPDSSRCGPDEVCTPDGCERIVCMVSEECDDGFVCNGLEACVDNLCRPGTPPLCDDGVDCTNDACSEVVGGCAPSRCTRAATTGNSAMGASSAPPADALPGASRAVTTATRAQWTSATRGATL